MRGNDILHALNDIDDEIIASAYRAPIKSIAGGKRKSRTLRKATAVITTVAAVCLLALLSVTMIRNARIQKSSVSNLMMSEEFETSDGFGETKFLGAAPMEKAERPETDADQGVAMAMAEPNAEVTMAFEDAANSTAADFELNVPDEYAGYVLDYISESKDGVLEALYIDNDGEEAFCILKGRTGSDIPSSIASWSTDDFRYAVTAQGEALTEGQVDELKNLIN